MEQLKPRDQPDRRAAAPSGEVNLIRLKEVLRICGKSRSSLYEAIKRGNFPAPVKLQCRSSAWIKAEVVQWVKDCIKSSREK